MPLHRERKVQMRASHATSGPDQAYDLSPADILSLPYQYSGKMQIRGEYAFTVIQVNSIARKVQIICQHHPTVSTGLNRRAFGTAQIQPPVHTARLAVENPPQAKKAGYAARHRSGQGQCPAATRQIL